MDQIPKSLVVIGAFILAIVGIMLAHPQYSACQTQIEIFRKNMRGELFPNPMKRLALPGKIKSGISACQAGNSPGSCLELFEALKKLNRQMRNFPESCQADLGQIPEVKGALEASMALMAQIAWGEQPPESPEGRMRWFEAGDLANFCEARNAYIRLYGKETYEAYQKAVTAQLPGEPAQFVDGKCVNCDFRKKAKDMFPTEEIWKRSLFSIACSKYF